MAWAALLGDAGCGMAPSATLRGNGRVPAPSWLQSARLAMSGLRARIGPGSPSSPRYGQAVGQGDRAIVGVR